jgi:hypothetical protein
VRLETDLKRRGNAALSRREARRNAERGETLGKARQPEIVYIKPGTVGPMLDWVRDCLADQGWRFASEPKPGPNVVYWDRRIMPRICKRTAMQRDFCCCAPCRARRRRKHRASCRCWLCYADRQGAFIGRLGERTIPGKWALFLTQTYRTRAFPWGKDFPIEQSEPHPDFVRHFLARVIRWLEDELRERVEYFAADQYGETGGRLHQHIGLTSNALVGAAEELSAMRRADPKTTRLPEMLKPFASMLWDKAGLNRICPWEMDAGFYIGRYIGRDAGRCSWDFRVGPEPFRLIPSVGRRVIAVSSVPDGSSRAYRGILQEWHR